MRQSSHHRLCQLSTGAGFTLLEGIIAVAIISTALVVGLSLAFSNLTAAQNNSDRVIAGNLAREAIEVARNVRDSNWLKREANFDKDSATPGTQLYAWDDFFGNWPDYNAESCNGGCGNYFDLILVSNAFTNDSYNYKLAKVPSSIQIKDAFACINDATQPACRVRKNNSVYYQQSAAGNDTAFYRRIMLKPICYNATSGVTLVDDDENANCGVENLIDKGEKIGLLVTAQVVWQRGSKTLEVKLKERLYNWRNL